MGTRNLTMVISEGKTKVAQYGQWDGYPSGQGKTILNFLSKCADFGHFKEVIDKLRWITDKESKEIDKDPNWISNYPYLSRDCGGQILNAVYNGAMEVSTGEIGKRKTIKVDVKFLSNSEDFAAESLFCEWAYVIDLDKRTFEVYKGFNKKPLTEKDRFFKFSVDAGTEYNQVKMVKKYSLDKLPTEKEFLLYFAKKE